MLKKIIPVILVILFCFTSSHVAWGASTERRDYAFGWQYSKNASGLSLKIPFDETFYLQPVFAYSQVHNEEKSEGAMTVGLRALQELPFRFDFQPYVGVGAGYHQNNSETGLKTSNSGCEAFFGVEYRKYLLRPALEIAMGSYGKSNGTVYSGLSINFSLLYIF